MRGGGGRRDSVTGGRVMEMLVIVVLGYDIHDKGMRSYDIILVKDRHHHRWWNPRASLRERGVWKEGRSIKIVSLP